MSDDLTKEQKEELEKLQKEIIDEAKKVQGHDRSGKLWLVNGNQISASFL